MLARRTASLRYSRPMTEATSATMRTETDSMGAVDVPADRYWGAQTQRSLHHFAIGDARAERMPIEIVHAMGLLKRACAEVNLAEGRLDAGRRTAHRACRGGGRQRHAWTSTSRSSSGRPAPARRRT